MSRVVFPDPDGPSSVRNSPANIFILTESRANTVPYFFDKLAIDIEREVFDFTSEEFSFFGIALLSSEAKMTSGLGKFLKE